MPRVTEGKVVSIEDGVYKLFQRIGNIPAKQALDIDIYALLKESMFWECGISTGEGELTFGKFITCFGNALITELDEFGEEGEGSNLSWTDKAFYIHELFMNIYRKMRKSQEFTRLGKVNYYTFFHCAEEHFLESLSEEEKERYLKNKMPLSKLHIGERETVLEVYRKNVMKIKEPWIPGYRVLKGYQEEKLKTYRGIILVFLIPFIEAFSRKDIGNI